MRLPRYRMKMHEMLNYGAFVNACLDQDVEKLEVFISNVLDYYDNLPLGVKEQMGELSKMLEDRLQITDLL